MKKIKFLTVVAVLLGLTFLLSGCMQMYIDVVWSEDNSGVIKTNVGVDESILTVFGFTDDEILDGIKESFEEDADEYTVEEYSKDGYIGVIATIDVEDLTSTPTGATEDLTFIYTEEDGKKVYLFSGEYNGEDLSDIGDDPEFDVFKIEDMDMKMSITMPGEVTYHNADEQAGNKLIWNIATSSTVPIMAVSEVSDSWTAPADDTIKVTVDGVMVDFDQPPIIENGRTLVPLRAIFEAMGATVEWDEDSQTVTSVLGDITISLQIGSDILYRNGEAITLDVPALIVGGRTLVPARAVAESFGAAVDWVEQTRTVIIITG